MSENPDSDDNNSAAEDRHHRIEEIERLSLPRRGARRRSIYLGEKILCHIKIGGLEESAEIVDLSSGGLAVVEGSAGAGASLLVGQRISLVFEKGHSNEFEVFGTVSNISSVVFSGVSYIRTGIRFDMKVCRTEERFLALVGEQVFPCRGLIRPQAFCRDPFFFQEVVLFQIRGFSVTGMDLVLSARCRSIFPGQPVELDMYLPGKGRFLVRVINSELRYKTKKNQFRIFARYQNPDPAFLDAVSEHLVMFAPGILPGQLRERGFRVGDLSFAFELSYDQRDYQSCSCASLYSGPVSGRSKGGPGRQETGNKARKISCKLGPSTVAVFLLNFCRKDPGISVFRKSGYRIPDDYISCGLIELTSLQFSEGVLLVDILLPLLKNLVRIAVQSGSGYLLLECEGRLINILKKTGFRVESPSDKAVDGTWYLLSLDVRSALLNKKSFLPKSLWQTVYQDLYHFFRNQMIRQRKSGHQSSGS